MIQHRPIPRRVQGPFRGLAIGVFVGIIGLVASCSGVRTGAKRTTPPVQKGVKSAPVADRDLWQQPATVTANMGLGPGMRVIDLGAGDGYMMPWLSGAVGETGRVLSVEIDRQLVQRLVARKKRDNLLNVEVLKSTVSDLPVAELVDRILLLNTYPELADPVGMLAALRLRLRPGGQLIIIDYRPDANVPGPPVDERLALATVVAEARGAGFVIARSVDVLPRQYTAVFVPSEERSVGAGGIGLPAAATPEKQDSAP